VIYTCPITNKNIRPKSEKVNGKSFRQRSFFRGCITFCGFSPKLLVFVVHTYWNEKKHSNNGGTAKKAHDYRHKGEDNTFRVG
jgi:hypothetical protein